jgi:hypothetical protein
VTIGPKRLFPKELLPKEVLPKELKERAPKEFQPKEFSPKQFREGPRKDFREGPHFIDPRPRPDLVGADLAFEPDIDDNDLMDLRNDPWRGAPDCCAASTGQRRPRRQ